MNTTDALKLRWDKAEYDLQRAWDAAGARPSERAEARTQRAWDKAQKAKHAYEQALGIQHGFYDNYEPGGEG